MGSNPTTKLGLHMAGERRCQQPGIEGFGAIDRMDDMLVDLVAALHHRWVMRSQQNMLKLCIGSLIV
jgi:hypothetical protein